MPENPGKREAARLRREERILAIMRSIEVGDPLSLKIVCERFHVCRDSGQKMLTEARKRAAGPG